MDTMRNTLFHPEYLWLSVINALCVFLWGAAIAFALHARSHEIVLQVIAFVHKATS